MVWRARHLRCLAILASVALAIPPSRALLAEESSNAPHVPIQYRRIFVPADKMEAWPRDGEKLIPVEAREFESLVKSANDKANGQNGRITIDRAEYSARLDSNGQLQGEGRWTIAARSKEPKLLPLDDLSLILRNPRWEKSPQQPARIGIWSKSNQLPQRVALQVIRSGTLEFDWHAATPSAGSDIEIPWHVPVANSTRLTLDLPQGKLPRIEGGIVLDSVQQPSNDKSPARPLRRWVLALSPTENATLRIVNADHKPSLSDSQSALHEDVQYQIGPHGLEMTTTWRLDGLTEQKRELAVAIPPDLQLSSVKAGGRELAWRVVHDRSAPMDTALIELPHVEKNQALQITSSAWQPLVVGKPWRLPRLRQEGVLWSSGRFELSVATPQELQQINLTDCLETGSSRLASHENVPETHTFIPYAPAAAVEIELSNQPAEAVVRSGSSLTLADPNLSGRLVTQWHLSRGAIHRLTGKLAPGWIVEGLETVPADAMTDWFINANGKDQQVEVQLARPATSARSVRVIITARLQRFNLNEPFSSDTMRIVSWDDAKVSRHLLTFQSSDPYAVVPVGDLVPGPETLDAPDRELLDSAGDEKVFDITASSRNSGLKLAARRGQFSATIDIELRYENDVLNQEYRVVVEPSSGPVERLFVYSTLPLPDGARWIDKTSNAPIPAERILPADPQRPNLPKEGEVWLLHFVQPMSRPFEIATMFSTKRLDRSPVPVLFVPDATKQDARITTLSRNPSALWLEPLHLQPTPLPPKVATVESNDAPPVASAYRYDPADCRDSARTPKLWASAIAAPQVTRPVARSVRLESFIWPDGTGAHRATYELDRHGVTDLNLELPAGARLKSSSLDGRSLELDKHSENDRLAPLHLLGQTRPTSLSLCIETHDQPLTSGHALAPPTFLNDLPFVSGEWTIWIPEEFSAVGNGLADGAPKFNWRNRLFSMLGRPTGSHPFNPFEWDAGRATSDIPDSSLAAPTTSASQNQLRSADQSNGLALPSAVGWKRYHEAFISAGPESVTIQHAPAITAWAVAIFMVCFLGGCRLKQFCVEAFVIALGIAAAAALLLPFTFSSLASGAVLGFLLSLLIGSRQSAATNDEPQPRYQPTSAMTVATAILCSLLIATLGRAETSPATIQRDVSAEHKIYRILIPVDGKRQPIGTKYYVSDEALRAFTAASQAVQNRDHWLLSDLTIAGELIEARDQKDVVAGNWKLSFEIETFARNTSVVLPLVRAEADWEATAIVDGVPMPLEWRDTGRACAVEIPEPGRYSLVLSCTPRTVSAADKNRANLSVPPVPGAKIELRYPETAGKVSVPGMRPAAPTPSPNRLRADLDRMNRITAEWTPSNRSESGTGGSSLTELRLLHVVNDKLEATIKYIFEGTGKRTDVLTVAYDDRWQLLAPEKLLDTKSSLSKSTGQHLIQVPIPSPSTERQEIVLRWRLSDPIALGNLRLPPIDLTIAQPTRRLLAMSNDSTFEFEIPDEAATENTVSEFLAKWGNEDPIDTPQWVVSNLDAQRGGTLAIRPRETEPIVDEALIIAAGLTTLRAQYEATITPGSSGSHRIELSASPNLKIDDITVTADKHAVPVRWSRATKSRVNVFFGEQLTKPYRLVLVGTAAVDSAGKVAIPHVSTVATEEATQKTRVYREDDVHVELEGLPIARGVKVESPGPAPRDWTVRPVATTYIEANFSTAELHVTPGKFKLTGDTLTTLTRENNNWWGTFRCQLSVEDGDVDTLRIRVPSSFAGPFDVQSQLPATTELKPIDDQTSWLAVRLSTAVSKGSAIDMRIRSPLTVSSGTAVSMPAITLESLPNGRRYLGVCESIDSQPITWTENGLRPAAVPAKLRQTSAPATATRFYEVVAEPFQLVSRPPATPELVPQVRLSDTIVVADSRGTQRITTRLILAPHGLSHCTLQLPPNQTLVSAELDGRPAAIRQLDASSWQLALGCPQLPQAIEVISRSSDSGSPGNSLKLQRATLVEHGRSIPSEMSLWSFALPHDSATRLVRGADETSEGEQAALRFDRMVSIAEAAKVTAAELPSPDGFNWFVPWAKLLADTRDRTQQMSATTHIPRLESQVSHPSEDQIAQAATRLDKWLEDCRRIFADLNRENPAKPVTGINSARSRAASLPADAWTYYVAEGGNEQLALDLRSGSLPPSESRAIGLLAIVAAAAAGIWLMRRPAALDFLYRWPHLIGVAVGIAWWAWLWPSWLGLLIAAANVWLALRFAWPGRLLRTEASTVLRASRTN
jgi:hypothetical protein